MYKQSHLSDCIIIRINRIGYPKSDRNLNLTAAVNYSGTLIRDLLLVQSWLMNDSTTTGNAVMMHDS